MATKRDKRVWRTPQRSLLLGIHRTLGDRTHVHLSWSSAEPGDEERHEVNLGRWRWEKPIETRQDAILVLLWVARQLEADRKHLE